VKRLWWRRKTHLNKAFLINFLPNIYQLKMMNVNKYLLNNDSDMNTQHLVHTSEV
jgi:hypothetical protein